MKKAGRPTDYSQAILKKAREYVEESVDSYQTVEIDGGFKKDGTPIVSTRTVFKVKIPTIEGLALHLGLSRETVYAWEKEEDKKEFSDIIGALRAKQANELISKGLSGDYNPTIAKVLLTKHGYREGIEATGKDGEKLMPETLTKEDKDALIGLLNDKASA